MGHIENGDAGFLMNAADLELDFLAQFLVERAQRFIKQQQPGPLHQRPGERSTAAPRGASGSSAPSTAAAEKQLGPGEDGPGEPVTIVFGGDIHYDGPLGDQLRRDPSVLLAGIAPAVESADVAVANLETAVGTGGAKATKSFNFLAPPEALDAITAAGIDVIGMANNHSLDFGQEGFAQTLAAIGERKAPVIGVGENEAAAYRPWTATVKGNRIAILSGSRDTAVMGVAEALTQMDRIAKVEKKTGGKEDFEALFEVKGQKHVNLEAQVLASYEINSSTIWSGAPANVASYPTK